MILLRYTVCFEFSYGRFARLFADFFDVTITYVVGAVDVTLTDTIIQLLKQVEERIVNRISSLVVE